jgi:hypothetical protein
MIAKRSTRLETSDLPRKAVLRLNHDDVKRILNLPFNVNVVGVVADPLTDQVDFIVSGHGLPEDCYFYEGMHPRQVKIVQTVV